MFTKADCSKNLQIENQSLSCQRWSLLCMAFKHSNSFATYLAANFDCNRFRITPDIVSKLLRSTSWSLCAAQFKSEQTLFPQIGCLLRPAALHRIPFRTCCFVPISFFTQRPMTDRKIEQSNGRCFGRQQLLADSIKIFHFHLKQKVTCSSQEFTKHQNLVDSLNWVRIARVVASFHQASWTLPAATAAHSETPYVCVCQSNPRKQSRRAAPRAWPLILTSKPVITFWKSLQRDCQMTCRGSNLVSNLNSAAWPTSCKGFIAFKITA